MSIRRAHSNYFELDADRKRANTIDGQETFSERLGMMNVIGRDDGDLDPDGDFKDERSIDYCCDILQAKFGFQDGSVNNQREHALLLLANCKSRAASVLNHTKTSFNKDTATANHVALLHRKMVGNYVEWCQFLKIEPIWYSGQVNRDLYNKRHMEIMLYLLIWGEAGNIRHMPECICYLFHKMMTLLNADTALQHRKPEDWYLTDVIRPIWKVCSGMQRKNALGKFLEHTQVRNYDDLNEFFWKLTCLNVPVDRVGQELEKNHGKTYYEHRSILTLVLNYFRIFHFNFMFLFTLSVLQYAVTISPNGAKTGFDQFSKIGEVVEPYTTRDLKLSLVFLVFAQACLNMLKCILEVAHGWQLLTSPHSKSPTSSKSLSYGGALSLRLLWNGSFTAIFFAMMTYHPTGKDSLLNNFIILACVFLVPGVLVLVLHAIFPQSIIKSFGAKFIREGESCYTGRNMAPPLSYQVKYITFWVILWSLKAVVSYWVLITPLMLPSLAIFDMQLTYTTSVVSYRNIGVIIALWAPVFFVFCYDTQIYFTIFQALLGAFQGIRMKTGELHGFNEIAKAFRIVPQLFDRKVVTALAISNDSEVNDPNSRAAYRSMMMPRFVVVWNEIINSFREGDLLDDKEAAILQYDIVQHTGEIYEPVFLSAGKLNDAVLSVVRLSKESKNSVDSELRVELLLNDCVSAIKSFFNAGMYVLETLLGQDDMDVIEALHLMEDMASRGDFMKSFNVHHIVQLRIVIVEFLEAVLELPYPDTLATNMQSTKVHSMSTVRDFVARMENLLNALQLFCKHQDLVAKLNNTKFTSSANGYVYAARGMVNLCHSDVALGCATRAILLLSLDKAEAMPRCPEAQRRLGFFMKTIMMDIPQLKAVL